MIKEQPLQVNNQTRVIPNPKRFEWESTELTKDFNVSEVFDLPASHRRGGHCHRGWLPGHKIPDRGARGAGWFRDNQQSTPHEGLKRSEVDLNYALVCFSTL